jgi:hypothetical protein
LCLDLTPRIPFVTLLDDPRINMFTATSLSQGASNQPSHKAITYPGGNRSVREIGVPTSGLSGTGSVSHGTVTTSSVIDKAGHSSLPLRYGTRTARQTNECKEANPSKRNALLSAKPRSTAVISTAYVCQQRAQVCGESPQITTHRPSLHAHPLGLQLIEIHAPHARWRREKLSSDK